MRWLSNLAAVMVRPRATIRRILDGPRDRMVLPLVLLAVLSGFIGDLKIKEAEQAIEQLGGARPALIVAVVVLAASLASVILFYVFAWAAYVVGRLLEGGGTSAGVRSALAWGLAPVIWALVYRIPSMFWFPDPNPQLQFGDSGFSIDTRALAGGCGPLLLFGLLDLAVLVWCIVLMSKTLGEAHGFSGARGLGTLAICAVLPIVIALAAILALH